MSNDAENLKFWYMLVAFVVLCITFYNVMEIVYR